MDLANIESFFSRRNLSATQVNDVTGDIFETIEDVSPLFTVALVLFRTADSLTDMRAAFNEYLTDKNPNIETFTNTIFYELFKKCFMSQFRSGYDALDSLIFCCQDNDKRDAAMVLAFQSRNVVTESIGSKSERLKLHLMKSESEQRYIGYIVRELYTFLNTYAYTNYGAAIAKQYLPFICNICSIDYDGPSCFVPRYGLNLLLLCIKTCPNVFSEARELVESEALFDLLVNNLLLTTSQIDQINLNLCESLIIQTLKCHIFKTSEVLQWCYTFFEENYDEEGLNVAKVILFIINSIRFHKKNSNQKLLALWCSQLCRIKDLYNLYRENYAPIEDKICFLYNIGLNREKQITKNANWSNKPAGTFKITPGTKITREWTYELQGIETTVICPKSGESTTNTTEIKLMKEIETMETTSGRCITQQSFRSREVMALDSEIVDVEEDEKVNVNYFDGKENHCYQEKSLDS